MRSSAPARCVLRFRVTCATGSEKRPIRGAKRGDSAYRDNFAERIKELRASGAPTPGAALVNPPAVLSDVVVVFVSPKTASNVGAMARSCAAFECETLRLVAPVCDVFSRASMNAAKGAQYLIKNALIVDDLADALVGTRAAVAFHPWMEDELRVDADADADADAHPTFYDDLDALVERFPGGDAASGEKLALVFGNEADGLSVEQLKMCDAVCSIPMGRLVESLSVTHAGVITLSRYFERRGARIDRR